MDEKAIRAALGIDDAGDVVEAIRGLRAENEAQKAVIASDGGKADTAEMLKLRTDLIAAQQKLLTIESENSAKIRQIESERRTEQAHSKVETLIAKGRIIPAMRDTALNLAETLTAEKFDEFVATLPAIDMTERGVATGSELADLEPTPEQIKVLRTVGAWDDKDPTASRIAFMRKEAAKRGMKLPAEIGV